MISLKFKNVEIDVCPSCFGVWLDNGEFGLIVELIGGPERSDLSKLGKSLPTIGKGVDLGSIESLRDVLDLADDVISAAEGISKIAS